VSTIGTIYVSGVNDRSEKIIRLVAFRAGIPLHIFMDLLAETLIARTWTERAFQSTEGTDIIEDVLARAVRDHPDLKEKIGKQSISQLMGFHIQPLYRKDIDEIDAEIAAERAEMTERREPEVAE